MEKTNNVELTYKAIDAIVRSNKEARDAGNYIGLVLNGQMCLNHVWTLVSHGIEQESLYRKFEARRLNELLASGERGKNGIAEVEAKATDYYREWQKATQTVNLLYEMTNLAKKLAGDVDKNLKAT